MNYFLIAAILAIIGVVPLLLRKRFFAASILAFLGLLVTWFFLWLAVPSTVWPLATPASIFCFILWTVSASIGEFTGDERSPAISLISWGGSALYAVLLLGTWVLSWGMFNADAYASMLGQTQQKNWTSIVQPKSPEHIRMMGDETALYIARKAVANGGTIGSQFALDENLMTLQRVNGNLVYVAPLDFRGFSQWSNSTGVPAYIVINAQDPDAAPQLVQLKGSGMRYTPGAYFGDNLTRYLRGHGFADAGIAEFNFELDDTGTPWWVVPTFRPTIGWDGWKLHDVATVNPVTGEIRRYAIDKAPAWIDRIMPESFIRNYLAWKGEYSGGWWNSWWGTQGLTKPEESNLIYSSDNRAEWVTGITSDSSNDDSLLAIAYTDSRTGKTVIYNVDGGATDSAILDAVNANQDVNYKHLHGTAVQMYNIYGSMAAVVPLLNASGAYQEVAIASVKNPQDVAIGQDQIEALRNYQAMLFQKGQQVALDNTAKVQHLRGTVDRIAQDSGGNGSPYLLHVAGVPRIFVASSRDSIKVPLTRPGDTVSIDYVASGEGQVPVKRFDNLSLPLDQTPAQAQLSATTEARQQADDARTDARDARKRIEDMPDQEVRKLLNKN